MSKISAATFLGDEVHNGFTEYDLRHAKTDHTHRARENDEVGISACCLDGSEAEFVVEPGEGLCERVGGHAGTGTRWIDVKELILERELLSTVCSTYIGLRGGCSE